MQLVASTKMRRAQERVLAGRPYAEKLRQVLADLSVEKSGDAPQHPLLQRRPVQHVLVVHVTPDRGLCGALPSNMNRRTGQFMLQQQVPVSVITVGKKGRDFMVRFGRDVKGVYTDLGDRPRLADTLPITYMVQELYTSGQVDQVYVGYSRFVNMAVQTPTLLQILPIEPVEVQTPHVPGGYIYEPTPEAVYDGLLPRFLETQIYHAILESIASEQSARMMAMRNATEAANDMVNALRLEMNKVRQEAITNELLDIVGGVAALSGR